ncbi:MAG: CoA-binding protein [Clostridiales bacterium]|nr:CoA-binding protein [Clostridiales bacterium]
MDSYNKLKEEMLNKKVWAVVGVTSNQDKFGYKIYKKLKKHGYIVYGINPKYEEVDGDKIYKTIKDLPEKPDCVNMVVAPNIGIKMLKDIRDMGIEYIWFQPGTFNEEVIDTAEKYNFKMVYYDCVLVELGE